LNLKPIGIIQSPYKNSSEAPFQGRYSSEVSVVEIYGEFADGLKDVEQFSHLFMLYWCGRADREKLQTYTPHGTEIRGVFACRSPSRPNPIAICIVKLLKREGNCLHVQGLDAIDGSYLLDIKPFYPDLDCI